MDAETQFLIDSFFNWLEAALTIADRLLAEESIFAGETALMVCFSVLDTMTFSRYGKPLIPPHNGHYSYEEIDKLLFEIRVQQPKVIEFLKKFTKTADCPFFHADKRDVFMETREGIELHIRGITDEQLFLLARNSIIHTGRNIGSSFSDTPSVLFPQVSTYAIDEDGKPTKYRIDGLSPKITLKMLRLAASEYKNYCISNQIDPRKKINPVAFLSPL